MRIELRLVNDNINKSELMQSITTPTMSMEGGRVLFSYLKEDLLNYLDKLKETNESEKSPKNKETKKRAGKPKNSCKCKGPKKRSPQCKGC